MARTNKVSLFSFWCLLIMHFANAVPATVSTTTCRNSVDGMTCQNPVPPKAQSLVQLGLVKEKVLNSKDLQPSLGSGIIMAGDIIYLRAHTGNHVDVENGVVACRFNEYGPKQMFRIEKDGGGAIHNSDTISLRTHEDKHVGVRGKSVSADWDTYESAGVDIPSIDLSLAEQPPGWGSPDPGANQTPGHGLLPQLPGDIHVSFLIETKAYGTDVLRKNDKIFLRTYTTLHLDVEGVAVQASQEEEFLDQQEFTIERDDPPLPPDQSNNTNPAGPEAIIAGETIYLRAHHGKFLEKWNGIGRSIRADWDRKFDMNEFRLDHTGGGPISHGDTVYLKTKDNYHVVVEDNYIRESGEGSWRDDMKFTIEKSGGGTGVINVYDRIYLRAHTGNLIYVNQPFLPRFYCYLCCAEVKVDKTNKGPESRFVIERLESTSPPPATATITTTLMAGPCDEGFTGTGADYRGCQNKTRSGLTCQRWDSQSPNEHYKTPERYPDSGLVSNFCRNPDGESAIWCYTMSDDKRWESCDSLAPATTTIVTTTTARRCTQSDRKKCPTWTDKCDRQFVAKVCPKMCGKCVGEPRCAKQDHKKCSKWTDKCNKRWVARKCPKMCGKCIDDA